MAHATCLPIRIICVQLSGYSKNSGQLMALPVNRCNLLCFSAPAGYFARLCALPISKVTRFTNDKMQERQKTAIFIESCQTFKSHLHQNCKKCTRLFQCALAKCKKWLLASSWLSVCLYLCLSVCLCVRLFKVKKAKSDTCRVVHVKIPTNIEAALVRFSGAAPLSVSLYFSGHWTGLDWTGLDCRPKL